jgi:hypothetical protein
MPGKRPRHRGWRSPRAGRDARRMGADVMERAMASGGKSSFARTMKAVLWSFFGVRSRADHEADTQLNPLHVIAAGLIAAAVFIAVLIAIVHAVVS